MFQTQALPRAAAKKMLQPPKMHIQVFCVLFSHIGGISWCDCASLNVLMFHVSLIFKIFYFYFFNYASLEPALRCKGIFFFSECS